MELNRIYCGDVLEIMQQMGAETIDCIITSPPYWQLRDYGFKEQWGLEPTYQIYLEHLWQFMDECKRILKKKGTIWINLGDSYSTQSGANISLSNNKTWDNSSTYLTNRGQSGLLIKPKMQQKCLLLIPHRFAIGCIDNGWIVRNDIIWAKRNGMPESVTDRFSKKHEYFFFMVKNKKYYFDLDGVRDELKNPVEIRNKSSEIYGRGSGSKQFSEGTRIWGDEKRGRNPGDVSDFWDILTQSSSENHYASYNFKLIEKPIIAGCPENGIILDPFCGTGTTLIRALQLDRQIIGIDGSKEYCKIAQKKIDNHLSQLKLQLQ